jgi:hypothetical protein
MTGITVERSALEAACLEGLIETRHGWRYRPSRGADAVLALLATNDQIDELRCRLAAAEIKLRAARMALAACEDARVARREATR